MSTSSSLPTVGMLGFGNMGHPAAGHLLSAARAAGSRFVVHARRPESVADLVDAGAEWSETAAGLAEVDVLLSLLPDLPQLESLLWGDDGIVAAVTTPLLILVASTSSPDGVRDLAARLAEATPLVRVVDCPVSGGSEGAEAASLVIMVGGDDDDVARAMPVLDVLGTPTHLGPLGSGEVAKACNQAIVAATVMALAEAAVLGDRAGLDIAALFRVLGGGYAGSRILETRGERIVSGDYGSAGPATYMVKDLGFALAEAHRTGARLPHATLLAESFSALDAAGLGAQDISVTRAYIESLTTDRSPE